MSENKFYMGMIPEDIRFNILYLNRFSPQLLYTHIMHVHPFVELFYVTKGEGVFMEGENKVAIHKGDLVIVNPQNGHCEYSSEENPLEFFVFAFTNICFERDGELLSYYKLSGEEYPEFSEYVGNLFTSIYRELCDENKYYLNMMKNCFEQIIIAISRLKGFDYRQVNLNSTPYVMSCTQFIEENITRKITLEDLERVACINKFNLIKQFKKVLGMTPMDYITELKIKKAIDMLHNTDMTVEEIAEKLGYINVCHFYQQFKKVTQKTPLSYRK